MRAVPTILITEDTRSLRRLYSHILIQAGYTVLEATSGETTLALLRSEQPDIVLLDRMLPDMDGNKLCEAIKCDPVLVTTYVILLSALETTEDDRASGLEAGADDYIVKPVGKRELLARIQVAIRLRQAQHDLEVILSVASAVRKARTREEIMDVILDQVMSLMHVVRTVLATVDVITREVVIERSRGLLAPISGARLPVGIGLTPMVLESGQPYRSNLVNAPDLGRVPADAGDRYAIAGAPLITDGQGIGVLWVSSDRPIGDQAVWLLSEIGDIAASAIHRVDLFQELQSYGVYVEQQVQERTRELEKANEQLRELDRLKSKFVSNMTHELRSPIASLRLYIGLLRQGRPERRQQFEEILQDNVERLGKLVEDIMSLFALEIAHYQPREMEPTDLNAVIGRVVAEQKPKADASGLSLIFEPWPALPLVLGDYTHLVQLISHLIVNALTFTQAGRVRVSTLAPDDSDMAAIRVEDSGIGIDPDDLPHVFERFYRGNHNRLGEIPGSGLGLAIVKEIIDIHQGEITVDSEVDRGTRVEVRLPIVPAFQPA